MELRDALTQIDEIRQQMARGQLFRGYRAATTAFSGFLAILTGFLQPLLISDAPKQPLQFVLLWSAAAAISLAAVGIEMIVRTRRSHSAVQRQLTLLAVEQFMPAILAGGLLAYVFCAFLPTLVWMLPALWMILFSLGVFASSRLLPREIFAVAAFYLLAGIAVLLLTSRTMIAPAWLMPAVFAPGQFATATILFLKLERTHA